jgi:hypothetical protein
LKTANTNNLDFKLPQRTPSRAGNIATPENIQQTQTQTPLALGYQDSSFREERETKEWLQRRKSTRKETKYESW